MYPGPEPRVPVNKLGLRDAKSLEMKEGEIVSRRIKQGLPEKAQNLTYAGFKAIHEHLFQDVYEWAGQERTYTTARNDEAPFALPEHIAGWMEKQFRELEKADYLRNLPPDEFAVKAADLVNEINAAHPFMEGNGRTQRVWLRQVAEHAGYSLDFRAEDREAWNKAAKIGFLSVDSRPMAELIESRLSPLRERTVEHQLSNDDLSRKYLESSRKEAAQMPELRNAVSLEAYIERKLRAQYRNDPVAVERGLSVARTKIAGMIARGNDIDVPEVRNNPDKNREANDVRDTAIDRDRER